MPLSFQPIDTHYAPHVTPQNSQPLTGRDRSRDRLARAAQVARRPHLGRRRIHRAAFRGTTDDDGRCDGSRRAAAFDADIGAGRWAAGDARDGGAGGRGDGTGRDRNGAAGARAEGGRKEAEKGRLAGGVGEGVETG